jgi:hypothetical protein
MQSKQPVTVQKQRQNKAHFQKDNTKAFRKAYRATPAAYPKAHPNEDGTVKAACPYASRVTGVQAQQYR